jgi:uncharacterized protein
MVPEPPAFELPPDPRIQPNEFMEVSWEMFGELCRALAMRVSHDFEPDLVVGVARAGVIPGAIIASLLRLDFYSMNISRREGAELVRDRPAVRSAAPIQAEGRRVVLVDEITTSGDTLRLGIAALRDVGAREIRTATTFARPRGYRPDVHALETAATVVFPWDRKVFDGGEWVINPRYADVLDG